MNVIIVDHDPRRRKRLQQILGRDGHDVAGFADGVAALRHFRESPYGVVIADPLAQKRDGLDLFGRVRAKSPPTQSYLISMRGDGADGDGSGCAGVGVREDSHAESDDFLSGTFRSVELLDRVRVAERALKRRREEAIQMQRIAQIPADSPHPILELTGAGGMVHANLACVQLLESMGWQMGRPLPAPLRRMASAIMAAGRPQEAEVVCGTRTFSFRGVCLEGGDVCLYGHDVTELEWGEGEGCESPGRPVGLALRDPLTGLPTQVLLLDRVNGALVESREAGRRVALVKVNVDNCADINDAYGHSSGDRVIEWVANCLREGVRSGDSVFRDSGDGFVLLLAGVGNRDAARAICSRFLKSAQEAGSHAGVGVRFTLSIGFALYPEDAEDGQTLIERAESALVEAKNAGRNCWRDYPAAVGANPLIGSERLLPRLMSALHARRLEAHYQPIIVASTGRVAGFEALVRWHDAQLGWVPPDRFIPMAEARGLISEIGRQMADMVFRQLSVWRRAGYRISAALNVSKQQLVESGLCEDLSELARQHGLSTKWIVLEVTERQALLNDPQCRETLQRLAAEGFRLSLDDFGSGHSTFDVVSELPFRELKINMALSRKALNPRGRHVVRAILTMCHDLGLDCVAEGIEDPALGAVLKRIGASRLQGYLYSPPLTAEASLKFLETKPRDRR